MCGYTTVEAQKMKRLLGEGSTNLYDVVLVLFLLLLLFFYSISTYINEVTTSTTGEFV